MTVSPSTISAEENVKSVQKKLCYDEINVVDLETCLSDKSRFLLLN